MVITIATSIAIVSWVTSVYTILKAPSVGANLFYENCVLHRPRSSACWFCPLHYKFILIDKSSTRCNLPYFLFFWLIYSQCFIFNRFLTPCIWLTLFSSCWNLHHFVNMITLNFFFPAASFIIIILLYNLYACYFYLLIYYIFRYPNSTTM